MGELTCVSPLPLRRSRSALAMVFLLARSTTAVVTEACSTSHQFSAGPHSLRPPGTRSDAEIYRRRTANTSFRLGRQTPAAVRLSTRGMEPVLRHVSLKSSEIKSAAVGSTFSKRRTLACRMPYVATVTALGLRYVMRLKSWWPLWKASNKNTCSSPRSLQMTISSVPSGPRFRQEQ